MAQENNKFDLAYFIEYKLPSIMGYIICVCIVIIVIALTDERLTGAKCEGYWITSTNQVLLSSRLYQQFADLRGNRAAQKQFFDNLEKVEPKQLPLNIKIS